ncbi:MAG: carboxypeptidase-like regulatory domain-containing protein [Candidatus Micrarchaeota archaeon]
MHGKISLLAIVLLLAVALLTSGALGAKVSLDPSPTIIPESELNAVIATGYSGISSLQISESAGSFAATSSALQAVESSSVYTVTYNHPYNYSLVSNANFTTITTGGDWPALASYKPSLTVVSGVQKIADIAQKGVLSPTSLGRYTASTDKTLYFYKTETQIIRRFVENNGPAVQATETIRFVDENGVMGPPTTFPPWPLNGFASQWLGELNWPTNYWGPNMRWFTQLSIPGSTVSAFTNYFSVIGGFMSTTGKLANQFGVPYAYLTGQLTDCNDINMQPISTDAFGIFRINDVNGYYKIKFWMPWSAWVYIGDGSGNTCLRLVDTVNFGDLTVNDRVDIDGYLRDENGAPLSGYLMRLKDCVGNPKQTAFTDGSGHFVFPQEKWGQYVVWADTSWGQIPLSECFLFTPGGWTFPNIQIIVKVHLTGYVKNSANAPLSGAAVRFTDCSDNPVASATTAGDGSFTLVAPYGTYKLKATYSGTTVEVPIDGISCYRWVPGYYALNNPIIIVTQASVTGIVQDEQGTPQQGLQAQFTDCSGNFVTSSTTDSSGRYTLVAQPGSYKLKIVTNFATFDITVEGQACKYYAAGAWELSTIKLPMKTSVHGYVKNPNGTPIAGAPMELATCSDSFVSGTSTDANGYFALNGNSGNYKVKVTVGGTKYTVYDNLGNSCFFFMGDVNFGDIIFTSSTDCSLFDNTCDGNRRNYNCYFDSSQNTCMCYKETCTNGCIPDQPYCPASQYGQISVDVDDINAGYGPVKSASVSIDGNAVGVTGDDGTLSSSAKYGSHSVTVYCPNGNYCGIRNVYVDGSEWAYFDCACTQPVQKGNLKINTDNPNGYPVANAYVFLDSKYDDPKALTNVFGFAYIENIDYGNHRVDVRYAVTNPSYSGLYQLTQSVNLQSPVQTLSFQTTFSPSNRIGSASNGSVNTSAIALGVIALEVVDLISIGLSTEEYCSCIIYSNQSAFGSGFSGCIKAIESCSGDFKTCTATIRREAGVTANKCWVEEAFLIGDIASPLIPVGLVGVVGITVGKGIKKVEILEKATKAIGKIGDDLFSYGKEGIQKLARWFDDIGIFRKAVDIGVDTTRWSDDAIKGLDEFVQGSPIRQDAGKKIARVAKEGAEEAFENMNKLRSRGVVGIDKIEEKIIRSTDGELTGYLFEIKAASRSSHADEVVEVSHAVRSGGRDITDFDAILNDNSILEFKSGNPAKDVILDKITKLTNAVRMEGRGGIRFVFENTPFSDVITVLNNAVSKGDIIGWEVLT